MCESNYQVLTVYQIWEIEELLILCFSEQQQLDGEYQIENWDSFIEMHWNGGIGDSEVSILLGTEGIETRCRIDQIYITVGWFTNTCGSWWMMSIIYMINIIESMSDLNWID